MDPFFLNACVSFFQFIVGMILAPVALELQYIHASPSPSPAPVPPNPEPASASASAFSRWLESAAAPELPSDSAEPYTKNIFSNFGFGASCVFGGRSHVYQDLCESERTRIAWSLALWVLCILGVQLSVAMVQGAPPGPHSTAHSIPFAVGWLVGGA
jgi:hypothetical protein